MVKKHRGLPGDYLSPEQFRREFHERLSTLVPLLQLDFGRLVPDGGEERGHSPQFRGRINALTSRVINQLFIGISLARKVRLDIRQRGGLLRDLHSYIHSYGKI